MTDKPVKNISASVRQRLMNLRQTRGEDYNALLTQYVIERFMYRMSKSPLADRFVLKGAMLFRVWAGQLHRPTKDLDLLGYGDSTPDAIAQAVRQVLDTPVADDGLAFDPGTVVATEIREDQEYGGSQVARLGGADAAHLDVGQSGRLKLSQLSGHAVIAFPTDCP